MTSANTSTVAIDIQKIARVTPRKRNIEIWLLFFASGVFAVVEYVCNALVIHTGCVPSLSSETFEKVRVA